MRRPEIHRRHLRRFVYTTRTRLADRLGFLARPPWRQLLFCATLVALVCVISYAMPTHRPAPKKPAPEIITNSTDHPSEDPITDYHSTATGSEPMFLRLPTIHAEGFVQKVGVDQHHQIAVPTNIHLAGWFAATPTPGDPGLSIIDGHLDGYRHPGIFAKLASLKPGEHFSVDLANGTTRNFQVKSVQSLPTAQATGVLFSQTPGITHQLNLITCSGNFSSSKGYDHRVVVTASLISSP